MRVRQAAVHEYESPTGLHWSGEVQVPAAHSFMHTRSAPTFLQVVPLGQLHVAVLQVCVHTPCGWLLMKKQIWPGPHCEVLEHGSPTARPVCRFSTQTRSHTRQVKVVAVVPPLQSRSL